VFVVVVVVVVVVMVEGAVVLVERMTVEKQHQQSLKNQSFEVVETVFAVRLK